MSSQPRSRHTYTASPEDSGGQSARVERIPAQRHALILEYLRKGGAASVAELGEILAASVSTVRRDLDFLAERGYIERSHGGAMLPGNAPEVENAIASHIALTEKAAIGRLAASRITPHMTVIFDSSTTVLEAARAVGPRNLPLTAITNDLAIAQTLDRCTGVSVIVPGGTLRPGSQTLLGNPGQSFMASVHADLALVGTHAISGDLLTDSALELVDMKRAMIASSRRVMVLADSSKFGPSSHFDICRLDRVDCVVSDTKLDPALGTEIEAGGTTLALADPQA